jgi:hypothetical protein
MVVLHLAISLISFAALLSLRGQAKVINALFALLRIGWLALESAA